MHNDSKRILEAYMPPMNANNTGTSISNLGGARAPNDYAAGGGPTAAEQEEGHKKAFIVNRERLDDPLVQIAGYGKLLFSQVKKKIADHVTALALPALAFNIDAMDERYWMIKYLAQAAKEIEAELKKKPRR